MIVPLLGRPWLSILRWDTVLRPRSTDRDNPRPLQVAIASSHSGGSVRRYRRCYFGYMRHTLRTRLSSIVGAVKVLGHSLTMTGWTREACEEARRIKRTDPLGPLASLLDGWEGETYTIPGTDVEAMQPKQGKPLAGNTGRLVMMLRPLLDQVIQMENSISSPSGRQEACDLGVKMMRVAVAVEESVAFHLSAAADAGATHERPSPTKPRTKRAKEAAEAAKEELDWARQVELVRATEQVLGRRSLNKGSLSRACKAGAIQEARVETPSDARYKKLVHVKSFLGWIKRYRGLEDEEVLQVRNAILGEIVERKR